jgi:signal transduction histidine kinase
VRGQRDSRLEPRQLTAATASVALAVTLLVVLVAPLRFAYRAPGLHLVLETAEGCVALAVAYLVAGRFREHRRWQELLLTLGLSVLAFTNLLLSAVPLALALGQDEELSRWAPLVVRLVGAMLVAAAAVTPSSAVVRPGRTRRVVLGALVTLGLLALGGWWVGGSLPPVVDRALDLSDSTGVLIAGHPAVVAAQVLSGLLYALAAACFTRRAAEDRGDELFRWLGAGCALAAVARVDYVLFPSLYSDFVHLGDVFRLGFYLCLLIGAAREVRSYWARAAVLEDRRRLARDLHDGLTQELSYIYARAQRLASHPDDRRLAHEISGAAGRALDEARFAISALTRPAEQAFGQSLQQTVEDLARRYDIQTVTAIEQRAEVTPEQSEAILRITGEALRNAVRHGQARCVSVRLEEDPLELVVEDDGRGFDPGQVVSRGFGLTSMRERAEGAGASYALTSADGSGTKVRVSWG